MGAYKKLLSMKQSRKTILILLNLILVLVFFNLTVFQKEKTLASGKLVLLQLAPVDPRSLMQGDYMQLRYATIQNELVPLQSRGYGVIKLNEQQEAILIRFQEKELPLGPGEIIIKYFYNGFAVNLGAESYFFEEGQASLFENAHYGGLRVDAEGNSILVGLYDANRKLIEPAGTNKPRS